ncbi:probable E3 ubiquitin-protein ligase makorin-1 [Ischnura elegans]|uniref:probable E3 ubiquitin-protein ligase makorin-1 n=1 Tax=Ischnura elegans TaxID=197161 RepID=UPI001ED89D01|nr:probable E3 ubiquitin-protein ligase makorin-1 [Ischnura elegans]
MAEGWGLPHRQRTQDLTRSSSPDRLRVKRRSAPVCRYFARGICSYADKCRFLHVENGQQARGQQNGNNDHNKNGKGDNGGHSKRKVKTPTASTAPKEEKAATGEKSGCRNEDWVNAPEFYPSGDWEYCKAPKTYAQAVSSLNKDSSEDEKIAPLCPYSKNEEDCAYGLYCPFSHRLLCDICNLFLLDPTDESERKKHISECIKKHERDMEISFAIQRSKDKTCGICFEVIMEKALRDQKFGILPNCNHCFCLKCIRQWRQAKNFDSKLIRACPVCRESSDFVCPSTYWVDNKEDKEKLIVDYKDALSSKDCKYFLQGRGKCPFGNKCFYLHAYPDGTKADVGPPVRQRRQNADGEIEVFQHIFLWDFLEERDTHWLYNLEILDDEIAFLSDSDDSEWSEYDFFL